MNVINSHECRSPRLLHVHEARGGVPEHIGAGRRLPGGARASASSGGARPEKPALLAGAPQQDGQDRRPVGRLPRYFPQPGA